MAKDVVYSFNIQHPKYNISIVEPEGVEPSSKRGKNGLSTCVVLFYFGAPTAKGQGYERLSSFIFTPAAEQRRNYQDFYDASNGTPP